MDYLRELYWRLKHPIASIRRYIRIKSFPVGTLVEDCRYHPCIVTENTEDGDIEVLSFASLKLSFCSLFHCGVTKLTPKELNERIDIYHKDGEKGLVINSGWTEKDWEAFEKEWR